MGEVGDQGAAFHAEIGAHARAAGIEALWSAGSASLVAAQAFGAHAHHFATTADLAQAVSTARDGDLPNAASLLVKGSRFMQMEQVVAALQVRGTVMKSGA
jgi:UDP-N-acetylmuramoyl-tripeptide--D-alanyl-D-alanine ligase